MPQTDTEISTLAVEYEDDETVFEGYLAAPIGVTTPRPGIALAHEWSGPNESMRRNARRLAALGWPCLLMDVYGKGRRGEETGDNTRLMAPLLDDRRLLQRRLLAGLAAAARPEIDGERIAAIGYCFGGLCALDLARAAPPGLRAVVSFHGGLAPSGLAPQPISASVLLLHGWEDPVAPPEDVLAIATELTAAGADWQLHAYGHALHAFTYEGAYMPERGIAHDPRADRRSWSAMRAFLEEAFGEASP